jgi:DnaJ family protein C protein 28
MPNIEELIQRAIQEGKFDALPGKGKPLQLDDNPLADPDWQLAYHILKENGFSLPWLELRQELEGEIEAARQSLRQAWERRHSANASPRSNAEREAEFGRAARLFIEQIEKINQRIFDYNLQTPATRFQMTKLKPEQEIKQICG